MYSYQEGAKSTLDFRPTPLVSKGEGEAKVEYENGNARIEVKVDDLPPPPKLGPYTTYILWALTPDGRASNQGVLGDIDGGKAKLDTQYSAPQFALIVTAEPHFAVSAPSDMIVLYNVADKLKGSETKVTQLTERSGLLELDADRYLETAPARPGRGRVFGRDRRRGGRRQVREHRSEFGRRGVRIETRRQHSRRSVAAAVPARCRC